MTENDTVSTNNLEGQKAKEIKNTEENADGCREEEMERVIL